MALGIATKSLIAQLSHEAMNKINERLLEAGGGFESYKQCETAHSRVTREITRIIDGDVKQYPNDNDYTLEIDDITGQDIVIKINKSIGKNPFGGYYQYGTIISVKLANTKKVRFAKEHTIRYF